MTLAEIVTELYRKREPKNILDFKDQDGNVIYEVGVLNAIKERYSEVFTYKDAWTLAQMLDYAGSSMGGTKKLEFIAAALRMNEPEIDAYAKSKNEERYEKAKRINHPKQQNAKINLDDLDPGLRAVPYAISEITGLDIGEVIAATKEAGVEVYDQGTRRLAIGVRSLVVCLLTNGKEKEATALYKRYRQ